MENNLDSNLFQDDNSQSSSFHEILYRYIRYWHLFLLGLIIAVVSAFLYLRYTPKVYETSSVILIKDEKKGLEAGNDILKDLDLLGENKIVENEIEIFKSRSLMRKVIESLKLGVEYYKKSSPIDIELYNKSPIKIAIDTAYKEVYGENLELTFLPNSSFILTYDNEKFGPYELGKKYVVNKVGIFTVNKTKPNLKPIGTIIVKILDRQKLLESNLKKLDITITNQKSTVLKLSYQDSSPIRGKEILLRLYKEYILDALNDKNKEATNTLNFIDDRLRLISTELTDVEKDVELYKSKSGFTEISAEATLFLEKAKEIDTQTNEVDLKIKVLDNVEKSLNTSNSNISSITVTLEDPSLVLLLTKLSELEAQREKYSKSLTSNNPALEGTLNQIILTKQAIRENIKIQRRNLLVSKDGLKGLENRIAGSIKQIPKKEREFISIKRQQAIKESLYLLLLQKKEETAISYASTVADSRLVDDPYTTRLPIKPNPGVVYFIAMLLGLGLPFVFVNIRILFYNRVLSRNEIERIIKGLTILGEISQKTKKNSEQLLNVMGRSVINEQFRTLRTNLNYLIDTEKRHKRILLTSSISGEGKSFISLNLSATLASAGNKVLLINLDIRKPKLHEYLKVSNEKGIVNYLIGKVPYQDIISKTEVENLDFISSGPIPPNPSELIGNERLKKMLDDLTDKYDYVFIDCSPVGLVTDALLVSNLCDTTLYVVRHDYTPKNALEYLSSLYKEGKIKSMCVIYNGVEMTATYGYGGYGYGYGYGYYEEEPGGINKFLSKLK